tara:strand:+ start:422 stop:880 length:459 start_codon:yes stop_codon:yes gene_type:complete
VQIKKIIISLSLLLVYSLGFAHNFIPHCHDVNEAFVEHSDLGHHHHQHAAEHVHAEENHQHVSHGSHMDENLYDFLVCILFEMEHQEHGSVFHYLPLAEKLVTENQTILAVVAVSSLSSINNLSKPKNNVVIVSGYFSPLINELPLRGPPLA